MGEDNEQGAVVDSSMYSKRDRLQGRTLTVLRTSCIPPSRTTPVADEWLPLTPLDILWMSYYTPMLCSFPADQVRAFGAAGSVVQHLQDSLAETLRWFFPLAGRVVTVDGPPRIHCNDAGAVFAEARVDVDLAELEEEEFQPLPVLSGLAAAGLGKYPSLQRTLAGLPALIIQVTHFRCGGITLAANWSHGVADGRSGLHFMQSWSEIARGLKISLLPDHRRGLVKPRDPLAPIDIARGVTYSPGARVPASSKDEQPNLSSANSNGILKAKQITTQVVEFTKDEIAKLRNRNRCLTRADCFSTHLWRTVTRARKLPNDAWVRLWVIIEGRKQCGLPEGYFGNVTAITPTVSTVKELLHEPIEYTANLIHETVAAVSGEWFQGVTDHCASRKERESLFALEPLGVGTECGVSYLVRFPFYELSFGFGRPLLSTRNTMGAWDGLVFILPSSRGEGHMVAMANLKPDTAIDFSELAHDFRD